MREKSLDQSIETLKSSFNSFVNDFNRFKAEITNSIRRVIDEFTPKRSTEISVTMSNAETEDFNELMVYVAFHEEEGDMPFYLSPSEIRAVEKALPLKKDSLRVQAHGYQLCLSFYLQDIEIDSPI